MFVFETLNVFFIGNMPRKTFDLRQDKRTKLPLSLPSDITVGSALDRVLRLVNVASKRYLTNKVIFLTMYSFFT